jgi:hypothetical protein
MDRRWIMTTGTGLSAQAQTPRAEPGGAERLSKLRELAVVCAWAVVGIMLTIAATWFGLEIQ